MMMNKLVGTEFRRRLACASPVSLQGANAALYMGDPGRGAVTVTGSATT